MADLKRPPTPEELKAFQEWKAKKSAEQVPVPVEAAPEISQTQSALGGALQGATLGFADELAGAGRGVVAAVEEGKLTDTDRLKQLYQQYRDISREKFKAEEEANPATFAAGEIGAGLGTMAIPGAGALTAGKGILGAAKVGAAMGGLGGLGKSEADVGSEQQLADIGTGAAIGGAAGAIGGGIAKGVGKLLDPSTSKRAAEKAAARAIDISKAEAGKLGEKRVLELGRGALDDILKGGATTDEEIRAAAKGVTGKIGPEIKVAREQASKLVKEGIEPEDILAQVRESLPTQDVGALEKLSPDYTRIKTILGAFQDDSGQIPYNRMREVQKILQEEGYNIQGVTPASAKTMARAERVVEDVATGRLAKSGPEGEKLASLLETLNKQYAPAATASRNLEEKLAQQAVKKPGIISSVKEAAQTLIPKDATQARFLDKFSKMAGSDTAQAIKAGTEKLAPQLSRPAAASIKEGERAANDFGKVADYSEEQINALINKAEESGSQDMARILRSLSSDTLESRQAKLFQLGQQPAFRKLLNSDESEQYLGL